MLVLLRTQGPTQLVSACCARALRAGVRPGMPAADARAVLPPHTQFARHDDARDAALLRKLARMCMARYAPVVAIDRAMSPPGLVLNIAGCAHIFGGEERMLTRVLQDLSRLGLDARGAIAPTYACARACAQYATQRATVVRDAAHARSVLSELPVAALGIDAPVREALHEVQVRTIGQLLCLPRASLAARFRESSLLHALAACLGEQTAHEHIEPLQHKAKLKATRALAGPCADISALLAITRDALTELCAALHQRGRGVRELEVCWQRSDLPPVVLPLALSAPTCDARHVWSLLCSRCEGLHLGHGVEHVGVSARVTARLRHVQATLPAGAFDASPAASIAHASHEHALLDTLMAKLGQQRVVLARLALGHHVDEASGAGHAASFVPVGSEERTRGRAGWAAQSSSASSQTFPALVRRRPALLLDAPARVLALSPLGAVQRVQWLGQSVAIDRCIGPERIAGAWWNAQKGVRCHDCDYYLVRDEHARWLWLRHTLGDDDAWHVVGGM
jgi:protein ImuB